MRKRRSGRILALATVAALAVAAAAWVWRRRSATVDWTHVKSLLPSSPANLPSSLAGSGPASADAAAAKADASVVVRRQTAPLSSAQLGAPLVHGSFVAACGAPDDMKVVVHLDVKKGRASNVSVKTVPPNPAIASCIDRAIRGLQWDVSPQAGHLTVTY